MKHTIKIFLLVLVTISLLYGNIPTPGKCNRNLLKGLYTYLDVEYAYTYRMDSTVMDKYAGIGLNLEYRIKWKDKTSCDHDLIVTKVTPNSITPEKARNLYKIGDVLHINVIEVTKEYMKYRTTFNGYSSETIMYRITDEMLMEK